MEKYKLSLLKEDINTKGPRVEFLDLAKGLCIVLVVVYHINRYYQLDMPAANFFKAFRLPLYFFLSGVFFKSYEGFVGFLRRKTNKLLIPFAFWYLFFSVLISLALYHCCGIVLEKAENFSLWGALTEFITREDFPNSPIWFLLCLFEINLVFYLVYIIADKCFHKYKALVISSLSLLLGAIGVSFGLYHINLPMYLDSSLSALPFFAFGYVVYRHTSVISTNNLDKWNWLITIVLFVLVYFLAGDYSLKFNKYSLRSALWMYPCGFMGTLAVVLLAKQLGKMPVVSVWGRYSIMILVTHRLIYQAFAPLVSLLGLKDVWSMLMNLILTLASYFALIPFMKRFMPHVTAQKDIIKVDRMR